VEGASDQVSAQEIAIGDWSSVTSEQAEEKTIDERQNRCSLLFTDNCLTDHGFCQGAAAGKNFRIGFLDGSTASASVVLVGSFRQELTKLGWIEGKNITIEYRFADQKNDRLPDLAAELRRRWELGFDI
jgi:hypothetical protein